MPKTVLRTRIQSVDVLRGYVVWQAIRTLGWSMIALSALIFMPWNALMASGLVMIAAHNLLDGIRPERFGSLGWLAGARGRRDRRC